MFDDEITYTQNRNPRPDNGTGSNGIAIAGIAGAASVLGSFFGKPPTQVYNEAPRSQNNNLLYGVGAFVLIIIILVVVKMR